MDSFPEHNSKQASQAEPTIEEIKNWDADELLKWFENNRPKVLKGDQLEKFKAEDISGDVFVNHAGDVEFFENKCNLPSGTSERLANLAREMAGGETAGMVQKGKEQDTSTDPKTRKRKSPPHPHIASPPKRTRVGDSLIINGEPTYFRSGSVAFRQLLQREGQVYFDRTRYISKLEDLDTFILFCRPRRFGKSLTISMLQHFHGLQYTGEHQSLYKGLDVQKDIDGNNENKKIYKPGQYFVLRFDFSRIPALRDLAEANQTVITRLNSSIKKFYQAYAAYLGEDIADLCQNIDSTSPDISLENCAGLVQDALSRAREQENEQLTGIQGIYVLVDEYDAFTNNCLESLHTTLESTIVDQTFRSFWSTVKSLSSQELIQRVFITGISPLSLSALGSVFNMTRNLSFDEDLAGLCGLKHSDLEQALEEISKHDKHEHLSVMTKFFNGYHFCMDKTVETVYNTETCLAYLQSVVERKTPQAQNPQNSEVSEIFLRRFATSASMIADLGTAVEYDEKGNFTSLAYKELKQEFTLTDLMADSQSAWRSMMIYFGGLTFDSKQPATYLRIPNKVAAKRIATAVLERYNLHESFDFALQNLVNNGKIERVLSCYRHLMIQRDVTLDDLTNRCEGDHRDSFYFCLRLNHYLFPRVEFQVTKSDEKSGRVDLLFQVPGRLIITEWKFLRINYLDVPVVGNKLDNIAKAAILCNYTLPQILQLKFAKWDKVHKGTIIQWIMTMVVSQLRGYIKSAEVTQMVKEKGLEMRACLVIIVGSRHILLWDMDKEGNLAEEPCLAGTGAWK